MMIVPNVGFLHFNDAGLILAIERRNDSTKFGIPGGKVDPEDLLAAGGNAAWALRIACSREVLEETGLVVMPHDLEEVFRGPCATPSGTWPNVAFMATRIITRVEPKAGEPMTLWTTASKLANPDCSPFHGFNRAMFESMGICL